MWKSEKNMSELIVDKINITMASGIVLENESEGESCFGYLGTEILLSLSGHINEILIERGEPESIAFKEIKKFIKSGDFDSHIEFIESSLFENNSYDSKEERNKDLKAREIFLKIKKL